jgi:Glycosyltransferase family 87
MGDMLSARGRILVLGLVAAVCAAGTWLYTSRVLIPTQRFYAAAHGQPDGIHSDLYPRWVGARELLRNGRDPYTMEITREIQAGFYGQPMPPDQPGQTQNYQQGFYYPVYIAFFLAPTLDLPFRTVQKGFFRVLLAAAVVAILLWLRLLRWQLPLWGQLVVVVFAIGSFPFMQALSLQQMTLAVAPLMAAAVLLLAADRPIPAGILLALATVKPQLVWLLLFWLALWTVGDWRRRYHWAASFLVTMAVLCAASEYYLPNWMGRFWQALREYHSYTGEMSVMAVLIGPWSRGLELMALALMTWVCWRERRAEAGTPAFAFTVSVVLAVTVLVVPTYGPYNQALLVPAVLIMVRERRAIWQRSAVDRVLGLITIVLIAWPWLASVVLVGLSFVLPPAVMRQGSLVPVWTALGIPVGVAAGMLVYALPRSFAASQKAGTS